MIVTFQTKQKKLIFFLFFISSLSYQLFKTRALSSDCGCRNLSWVCTLLSWLQLTLFSSLSYDRSPQTLGQESERWSRRASYLIIWIGHWFQSFSRTLYQSSRMSEMGYGQGMCQSISMDGFDGSFFFFSFSSFTQTPFTKLDWSLICFASGQRQSIFTLQVSRLYLDLSLTSRDIKLQISTWSFVYLLLLYHFYSHGLCIPLTRFRFC